MLLCDHGGQDLSLPSPAPSQPQAEPRVPEVLGIGYAASIPYFPFIGIFICSSIKQKVRKLFLTDLQSNIAENHQIEALQITFKRKTFSG